VVFALGLHFLFETRAAQVDFSKMTRKSCPCEHLGFSQRRGSCVGDAAVQSAASLLGMGDCTWSFFWEDQV